MTDTLAGLKALKKGDLVNALYNDWIAEHANVDDKDEQYEPRPVPHGKRIPYMGWYWRTADFVNGKVTIGREGSYVAVMENNKWGHPQRYLTPEEVATFVDYIDRAIKFFANPYSEQLKGRYAILADLRDWMQTLVVEDREDDW